MALAVEFALPHDPDLDGTLVLRSNSPTCDLETLVIAAGAAVLFGLKGDAPGKLVDPLRNAEIGLDGSGRLADPAAADLVIEDFSSTVPGGIRMVGGPHRYQVAGAPHSIIDTLMGYQLVIPRDVSFRKRRFNGNLLGRILGQP